MASFTDKEIESTLRLAANEGRDLYLTDAEKARGVGRLRFRAQANGRGVWYFRYTDSAGKQDVLNLGVYDRTGKGGLTLKQASERAGEYSRHLQSGKVDLRAFLAAERYKEEMQRSMEAVARVEAERQTRAGSLKALLSAYIKHLERQGKPSAQDARNLLRRNVFDACPDLAERRASEITNRDIAAMLAKLIDRGAGRTAGKVRSYIRSAYVCGLEAAGDPTAHPDLHGFNLESNPAAAVPTKNLAKYNRARDRNLNQTELRAFLKALNAEPGSLQRDAILLSLHLGGQRPTQLLRVRPADVDMDEGTITLLDIKGARTQPRRHTLPLTQRAREIVERLLARNGTAPFLFTAHGRVAMRTDTVSELVTTISAAMVEARTAREPFELRDLRRTAETMLASMGISSDVRAQLQSHGLGGVQQRHYDRHEYMAEKRAALEAWERRLQDIEKGEALAGNVVRLELQAS